MLTLIRRLIVLFEHKELLLNFTIRNLRLKYKGSILGFFWVLLNPLLTIAVFTFIFTHVVRIPVKDFTLFLLPAIFPWIFFSSSLIESSNSLLENSNLIKKVSFPREILSVSCCITNFITFLLSLLVVIPVLNICGIHQGAEVLLLPVLFLLLLLFTTGLALFLSSANVYFRDVSHILNLGLLFWFYLTPVFYPLDAVPERFYNIFLINPMVSFIAISRGMLLNSGGYSALNWIVVILYSVPVFFLGYYFFMVNDKNIAKEI